MSLKHILLVIGMSIFGDFGVLLSGVEYFVSPSGNDANTGLSQISAWQTVTKANSVKLEKGDKLLFEGGKTFPIGAGGSLVIKNDTYGTADLPITVSSYGTGKALLQVSSPAIHGIRLSVCEHVTISNLIIEGPGIAVQTSKGNGMNLTWFNNSQLQGVEVSGFRGNGVYLNGSHDSVISGVIASNNGYAGILTEGDCSKLIIRDCKTNNNPGDPREKSLHSGNGILLTSTVDSLVEFCEAAGNGANMGATAGGPVGIWAASSSRITIQHCISHDNKSPIIYDGGGFDLDQNTRDCIIQYNYSYRNHGAGYLVYTNDGTFNSGHIIRYNISEDDAAGSDAGASAISISGQSSASNTNIRIHNNTIINRIKRSAIGGNGNFSTSSNSIRNNLMIVGGGAMFTRGLGSAFFQGNLYWNLDGTAAWPGLPGSPNVSTLAAWRSDTKNEMLNNSPVGIYADPLITLPGNGPRITDPRKLAFLSSYRTSAGSPAIDGGINLKSLFTIDPGPMDFFGTALSGIVRFDIGIHEATSAVLPPSSNTFPVILTTSALRSQISL